MSNRADTKNSAESTEPPYDVLVVGAGISGIGAGKLLLENGFENFVILEKASDLGGTWRDNTYPGCACDVPSALYSYSFEQKKDWTRTFSGQAEILEYVKATAEKYDIPRYVRFQQAVEHAQWHEDQCCWEVRTVDHVYRARVVITCGGYLHEPVLPDIPGLKNFSGKVFHSARWDHEHGLSGERVAVVGTGASAIQFVPEIQPLCAQLTIYQRTPQWVLPKADRKLKEHSERFFQLPHTMNVFRQFLYGSFEVFGIGFRHPRMLEQVQKYALAHLRKSVADPELRRKLTPNYILGCKRVLLSNHYYPAVCKPNVDLLATGLSEVRGNTLVGQDGSEREVDTVILGTGFHVTEQPIARHVFDGQGRSLRALWQDTGMRAYRGTVIKGLPNAFMILGPNVGIGHNSAYIVIEAQLNYVMSALRRMRKDHLARIEVRADVHDRYNEQVQAKLQGTVWNTGGCSSYYLDSEGRNTTGYPWGTIRMREMLSRFEPSDFHCRQLEEPQEVVQLAT